ncbi:MAG TPA: helix-turn-helix domain-containing protein, partial [Acidimicrobiales bacterium]
AVVGAAVRLFGENGWAGTGMRDVARAAGVAVETVYANFGSKADLLLAAVDVAVVGDAEPVPLRDRPEFAALAQGSLAERAAAAARLVREINERTRGIGRALREAAVGDSVLEARLAAAEERRRDDVGEGARLVARRPVGDTERDGLWALLGMEVYALLVDRAGWSAARYERWLADTIVRLLTAGTAEEDRA